MFKKFNFVRFWGPSFCHFAIKICTKQMQFLLQSWKIHLIFAFSLTHTTLHTLVDIVFHLEISIVGHYLPTLKKLFSKKFIVCCQFINDFMHGTIHRFVHIEATFHGWWCPPPSIWPIKWPYVCIKVIGYRSSTFMWVFDDYSKASFYAIIVS